MTPDGGRSDGRTGRRNVRGGTRLQSKHRGGPPANREAKKRVADALRIAARRKKAWELFLQRGSTFVEIGAKLGVSGKTAYEDVVAYRDEAIRHELFGDVDSLRMRQQLGIDALIEAHWRKRGKKANAEVILDAFAQEARLMGLNLQRKDTFTAEQVFGLVRGITELFMEVVQDPEARRQFSLGLRRKVGGALPPGQVIDAAPQPQKAAGR